MRAAYLLPLLVSMSGSPACAGLFSDRDDTGGYSQTCRQEAELAPAEVHKFYEQVSGIPVWTNETHFKQLLEALDSLSDHGLNPEHYRIKDLRRQSGDPEDRECLATDAWLAAAAHLIYGKLDPKTLEPDWTAAGRSADLAGALREALRTGTVSGSLLSLAPRQREYAVMTRELRRLRTLAHLQLEPLKPLDGRKLKKKKRKQEAEKQAEKTRVLQAWLAHLDPSSLVAITGELDEPTVLAVANFQKDAGLPADGKVNSATVGVLERKLQSRINQVRVNLERWRWLPDDLGRRHVVVNIAGFSVTTYENGNPVRTHAAIVGKLYRRTPVFSDEIGHVVFNPWWETPPSLASTDQLDHFKRDPEAAKRMGFQVLDRAGNLVDPDTIQWNELSPTQFPYRLRQAPGEQNPLGRVKIMFPNAHNVYLHDTPLQGLFAQRQRAFSSGCIRVQFPLDLVEWLLAETPAWDRERINKALETGTETRANLAEKIPVHILYLTVTAERGGALRFIDDIYERDGRVLDGLDREPAQA